MTPESFADHFHILADAPNGIQKLRELILQLAVQGKLVPQNPKDEPASLLLKKINVEKQRLAEEGKFKVSDSGQTDGVVKAPFQIPDNWVWCGLDDIAAIARGGSPRPIKSYLTDDPSGLNWIKIGDSTRGSVYIDSTRERIRPEGLKNTRMVLPGDLILSNSMSFGYPYIVSIQGCIHDGWLLIRTPTELLYKLYIYYLLLSSHAKKAFSKAAAGAVVQNLNAEKVRQLLVPLPPLAEQKCIVAKVDQLMALCDDLAARQQKRNESRITLNGSCLNALTAPDGDTVKHAWNRIRVNFDLLYDCPENVNALRQSILQLAVQGKLVPQNPKDEPASVLLEKIRAQKEKLIKEGRIKKQKPLPPIDPDELPYELPGGWEWVRLGHLGITQTGTTPPKNRPEYYGAGHSFVKPADISAHGVDFSQEQITDLGLEKGRLIPANSALMVCIGGSIGKVGYVDRECSCNQQINVVTPLAEIDGWHLVYLLKSPFFQKEVHSRAPQTTLPILSKGKWEIIEVPLQPLAEQKRIVAKVDQLMALCDDLEAKLSQSQDDAERLMGAVVNELVAA